MPTAYYLDQKGQIVMWINKLWTEMTLLLTR